jgi:hypothetical protein
MLLLSHKKHTVQFLSSEIHARRKDSSVVRACNPVQRQAVLKSEPSQEGNLPLLTTFQRIECSILAGELIASRH